MSSDSAKSVKKDTGHAAKQSSISREQALELLKKYNKEPFHIQHALTVEGVMRWYAKELGHAGKEEFIGFKNKRGSNGLEYRLALFCRNATNCSWRRSLPTDLQGIVCLGKIRYNSV